MSGRQESLYLEDRCSLSVGWGLGEVEDGREGRDTGRHVYKRTENSDLDLRFHFPFQECSR